MRYMIDEKRKMSENEKGWREHRGRCLEMRVRKYGLPDYAQTTASDMTESWVRRRKNEEKKEGSEKRGGGKRVVELYYCHGYLQLSSAILLHVLALSNVAPEYDGEYTFDRSIRKAPFSNLLMYTFFLFFFHYHSWYSSFCGLFRCFACFHWDS